MKIDQASTTAYFIAESLLHLSKNASLKPLFRPKTVELNKIFVETDPRSERLMYKARRRLPLRPLFAGLVNLVVPGIQNHYLLRKLRIEEITTDALNDSVRQVVILGAGFDTLALRLHENFPDVTFIELDHPATQRIKRRASENYCKQTNNVHFVAVDLARADFANLLLANDAFRKNEKTLFIAEGLLMYLREPEIESLFDFVCQNAAFGSKFAFTFMERQANGHIAFQNSSALVDLWLKMHDEPFTWGIKSEDLPEFLRSRGFSLDSLDNSETLRQRYLTRRPDLQSLKLARGDSLCVASVEKTIVSDIHSRLNRTSVSGIERPRSVAEVQAIVERACSSGKSVSIAGGFHAMGGQQFLTDSVLIDMSETEKVISFEPEKHLIEVGSGMTWDKLIAFTSAAQPDDENAVGIRQKQTGADLLSIGGALSANIHGRGLLMKPFIDDIESFDIVTADGMVRRCSREENRELFGLAVGGYGLFGIVVSVKLRLARRQKLRRIVIIEDTDNLPELFAYRIENGYTYGDFQFAIAPENDHFLRKGVFSCYRPVPFETEIETDQQQLSTDDWKNLLLLAHADKQRAFELYSAHYLSTNGLVYWSDAHQLSVYLDGYHQELDRRLCAPERGSEMITEIYVPLESLPDFLKAVRRDFRENDVNLIYGTIRLIDRDDESFLAWANRFYACIVFNLHVDHTPQKIKKAKRDFRRLIDRAIEFGGNYYLTYHGWAAKDQILACYPQMPDFLELKVKYDRNEVFSSNWHDSLKQTLQ